MPMLSTNQLTLTIDQKAVLANFTYLFQLGRFYAIAGPNGSGKSTLLRCLCRLENSYKGNITLNGQPIDRQTSRQRAVIQSYIPQQHQAAFGFTVSEFVEMGQFPHDKKSLMATELPKLAVADALKMTDTHHLRNQLVNTLSGGELQRVVIAQTLLQQTPLILLDEPFSQLDIKHQHQMLKLFHNLCHQQNRTVICVLHDFNQILNYADEVLVMNNGHLVASGHPYKTLTPECLETVFGIKLSWAFVSTNSLPGLLPTVDEAHHYRKTENKHHYKTTNSILWKA